MTQAWLIRAGRAGEREQWALRNSVSGGGFAEVDDMTHAATREAVAELVLAAYPNEKEGAIPNISGQLWALRDRMNVGDLVVMPLKNSPVLAIGRVSGEYQYRQDPDPALRHVRPVDWLATDIPRTAVKQDLLYSLGAFLTICEIRRNDAAHRISVLARGGTDPGARTPAKGGHHEVEDERVDPDPPQIDLEQYAFDRLSTYVVENFAGYRMQALVAAVLEAEGFTCKVLAEGPDQGVDVLAGKGPLGLDEPRLVVQVKSEAGSVGSPVVQQLLGAMNTHQTSQGLLVAWGGVKKPAEQLLANQYFRVRVWSSKELLEAVFRNYDRLSEEIRKDLPLKRIWTLVEEAG
jgi:restriction system protein